MAEIPGPGASVFGWYATFVGVLLGGAIVGALLGWAEYLRRTGGRPHWRLLALSPLVLGVLPLTVPGAIAQLSRGIGTAGMAVALLGIGLGYGVSGLGPLLGRVLAGGASLVAALALVLATTVISDGRVTVTEPRGAWTMVLGLTSILTLGLAASIPFRPVTDG